MVDDIEWKDEAACMNTDPEIFFDEACYRDAKRVCRECPVVAQCLDDAMRRENSTGTHKSWGIFGGLTPGERNVLAGRRKPYTPGPKRVEHVGFSVINLEGVS